MILIKTFPVLVWKNAEISLGAWVKLWKGDAGFGTSSKLLLNEEVAAYFISVSDEYLCCMLVCLDFVFLISMGDFQQFEQDFYQAEYYIDDQGQSVAYYENPACYDE